MSKEVGARIKEARLNAGLSQAALAEKAECVTASNLSKAERGEKELTPEQLEAVAKAAGVTVGSLTGEPETPAELTDAEKELLKLFNSADADTKNAAVSALKGEKPAAEPGLMQKLAGMLGGAQGGEGGEGGNAMASLMGMLGGMMGGNKGGEAAEGAEGGQNPMAGMMGMLGGMMGGQEQKKEEE